MTKPEKCLHHKYIIFLVYIRKLSIDLDDFNVRKARVENVNLNLYFSH